MIERITDLLNLHNILSDKEYLLPVTEGASGAYIFSIEEKYIVKYAYLPELEHNICRQFQKEFDFYKFYGKGIDFIPDIVLQTASNDEILIVMKQYCPIKNTEWNENLQKAAIEICARINAVNTDGFEVSQAEKEQNDDAYPLSVSYENWECLQKKFPGHIDALLLKEMYQNFNEIYLYAEKLAIPKTLCHGDFHPNNFLKHGNKLIVCDWHGVNIGKGIGDVAFFISRGADMGLSINRDKLIEMYYDSLFKYTNIKVDVGDLYKHIAASEFCVSFRFWAEYLQTSDIDRIMGIYASMADSYSFLV